MWGEGWREGERKGGKEKEIDLVFEVRAQCSTTVIVPWVLDSNITKSVATSIRFDVKYCYRL